MTDHPNDRDESNRYQREAAYWREQCEELASALADTIPYLDDYHIEAKNNGHPDWIKLARKGLNGATKALANYTASLNDGRDS